MKRANPLVMANRTTFFALMSALGLVWFLTGCMPRGETRTLEQILTSAKENYMRAPTTGVPDGSAIALKAATTDLDGLVAMSLAGSGPSDSGPSDSGPSDSGPSDSVQLKPDAIRKKVDSLASSMEILVRNAGYTARPALGELIREYQAMSVAPADSEISAATLQLLAARTYTLFASELDSTKFSVRN